MERKQDNSKGEMMDQDEFRELFFREVILQHVSEYGVFNRIDADSIGVYWIDEESLCAEVTFHLEAVEVRAVVRREKAYCWQIEIGEDCFEDLSRTSFFLNCVYSLLDTHNAYKDEIERAMEILDDDTPDMECD